MNPKHYYHTPVKPVSTRVSCPVCHEAVYSKAGIHPQCAVVQSDPPRPKVKKLPTDGVLDPAVESGDPLAAVDPVTGLAARPILPPVNHGWRTRR